MQLKVLTLRYSKALGAFDSRDLESFQAQNGLLGYHHHFFECHGQVHLALLLPYSREPDKPQSTAFARASNHAESDSPKLTPDDQALFNTIKDWRLEKSKREGVPPYVILTNKQLKDLIKVRPQKRPSLEALRASAWPA